jgi:tripartite-type tricarboxylate transporter receptor subunit TctC
MPRVLSLLILAVLLAAAAPAAAQYPERAVTLICPFPAGGAMDTVARGVSEAMKRAFPRPVVVVNRPGAAGTIGNTEVVQAKPDGYTIGISAIAVLTVQPHITDLPYKGPDTYAPIVKLVNLPIVLAVRADAPWKTAQELLAAARQSPGKLRASSPGIGTILHLDLEELKRSAGVDITHVPFAGNAEAVPALLGGHVEMSLVHPSEIVGHVQAGKARVLAVFEPKRNPMFADAPTTAELGHDVAMGVFYVLIAPKGTPPAIVQTLNEAARRALEDPAFIALAKRGGFDIDYQPVTAITRELMDAFQRNEALVKRLGLRR